MPKVKRKRIKLTIKGFIGWAQPLRYHYATLSARAAAPRNDVRKETAFQCWRSPHASSPSRLSR